MTADFDTANQTAHQANIAGYRRLLRTPLTDHERQFIEQRLAEEEQTLRRAAADPHLPILSRT